MIYIAKKQKQNQTQMSLFIQQFLCVGLAPRSEGNIFLFVAVSHWVLTMLSRLLLRLQLLVVKGRMNRLLKLAIRPVRCFSRINCLIL